MIQFIQKTHAVQHNRHAKLREMTWFRLEKCTIKQNSISWVINGT